MGKKLPSQIYIYADRAHTNKTKASSLHPHPPVARAPRPHVRALELPPLQRRRNQLSLRFRCGSLVGRGFDPAVPRPTRPHVFRLELAPLRSTTMARNGTERHQQASSAVSKIQFDNACNGGRVGLPWLLIRRVGRTGSGVSASRAARSPAGCPSAWSWPSWRGG